MVRTSITVRMVGISDRGSHAGCRRKSVMYFTGRPARAKRSNAGIVFTQ